MKLSEELKWRGFVNQTTYSDINSLDKKERTFYWGVDPSSSSMTIGNLAAAMMVHCFIRHGYKPVLLVGGATGMIGDPDGKAQERDLLNIDELEKNKIAIAEQYKKIFKGEKFDIVDNLDWFKDVKYLDFLRTVGKHVPMRTMVNREFVQSRLKEGGAGISYAEFSYSLIQGYDFLQLYKKKGVTLQLAGADQWGNSIAGVDLIRRIEGGRADVWTAPLIVNKSTGKKFGKTEEGAVWLDEKQTSVYEFYQFWLNVEDESVEDFLKIYTLLSKDQISSLMKKFEADKASRLAQKTLAYEVTGIVHGLDQAENAKKASEVLFGKMNFIDLTNEEKNFLAKELPGVKLKEGLVKALNEAGLAGSNSEAMRAIQAGAVTLNGKKVEDVNDIHLIKGKNLIKKGKNNFAIIES